MELKKQRALALIAGPIQDAGQLCLAMVINEFEGEDGWAVMTGKQLLKATRMRKSAGYAKLNQMEKMGLIEWRKTAPQAVRVIHDPALECQNPALGSGNTECQNPALEYQNPALGSGSVECQNPALQYQNPALQPGEAEYQNPALQYQNPALECQNMDSPNASAYLPKRYKDKKEKEEKEKDPSSSSSPGTELMVITGKQAEPISTLPDQPAAQPPAIVDQGAQLPAKVKRKTPRKNPPHRIPEDWEPKAEAMAGLVNNQGIPREFCEALIWEFRIYWTDRGDARPGWDATFVRHAKDQWKREQQNEQNTQQRERFTDASGRRISESTRVMQDIHDNVLANAHVFADIDEDKPF